MSSLYFNLLATLLWLKIFTESTAIFLRKVTGRGFPRATLPESGALVGKSVVITGANRGVGLETAKAFARLGATVILGCRDLTAGQAALEEIKGCTEEPKYHRNLHLHRLDLASFTSIGAFARQVRRTLQQVNNGGPPQLHYLINNAGVMMTAEERTEDGLELQFGANYLGPFLLTHLLLDLLKAAGGDPARIVNLSSISHNAGLMTFDNLNLVGGAYTPLKAYAQSKLATVLWSRQLAKRLPTEQVTVYSVHPGIVQTELYARSVNRFARLCRRLAGPLAFTTAEQGAQTTLYCALEPALAAESGHYYKNCKRDDNMTSRVNDKDAERLWTVSMQLLGLAEEEEEEKMK